MPQGLHWDQEAGVTENGVVNERIVEATHKAGGAKRFIFTTVSHDVAKVRR